MDFTATVAGSTDSAAPRKGAYVVGWVWVLLKGVGCLGPAFRASAGGGPGNICSFLMVGKGLGVVKGGVAGSEKSHRHALPPVPRRRAGAAQVPRGAVPFFACWCAGVFLARTARGDRPSSSYQGDSVFQGRVDAGAAALESELPPHLGHQIVVCAEEGVGEDPAGERRQFA